SIIIQQLLKALCFVISAGVRIVFRSILTVEEIVAAFVLRLSYCIVWKIIIDVTITILANPNTSSLLKFNIIV
ncbi:MAG: hypothetical protein ABIO02_02890, partial [Patescibacteria group bacterium]